MLVKQNVIIALVVFIITALITFFVLIMTQSQEDFTERVPEVSRTQFVEFPDDIRNIRGGEIILVFRSGLNLYFEVYTNGGHNQIPQDLWDGLDANELANEYGAERVILNGPRFPLMNRIEESEETKNAKVVNFGGIEMSLAATIERSIFEAGSANTYYNPVEVKRSVTFFWDSKSMVYELISPNGEVYIMQSYTQIVDKDLTIDDLELLGSKLNLPEGWTYISRILDEDLILETEGSALVLQDDFQNSYRKVE